MPTPRPSLLIRLTHSGVYADGRPNTSAVQIPDLDVGYENQNRKVPVYVPPGGFIDINASSRSMLSYEQGGIAKFTTAGVIFSRMFFIPESYPTASLPLASQYPAGTYVWNSTEATAYWSDGANWVTGKATPVGPAGGDLQGTYPNPFVKGLEGYEIEAPPPANGDALLFDGALQQWVHAPIVFGGGPPVGPAGGDLFGVYPNPTVTGLQTDPLAPTIANGFIKRDGTNTGWEEVAYGAAANTVCEGNDLRLSNARTPTGAAGGDLSGNYPNPTVDGLQTRPVDNAAPSANDVLGWDGAKWTPTDPTTVVTAADAIFGVFSDTTDQPIGTVPSVVTFNTVEGSNGVSLVGGSQITVAQSGLYSFTLSPQLFHGGGGNETIRFWARINGSDVPRSASSFEMGNNNNRVLPFIELILSMTAGQHLEWVFVTSDGTDLTLEYYPEVLSPPAAFAVPAIPSIIANVRRIGS